MPHIKLHELSQKTWLNIGIIVCYSGGKGTSEIDITCLIYPFRHIEPLLSRPKCFLSNIHTYTNSSGCIGEVHYLAQAGVQTGAARDPTANHPISR